MIVFNQTKKREVRDGAVYVSYFGEDTQPIARKDVLLIADGVGGNSTPHTRFDFRLFNEKKFYSLVFGSIFEEDDPEIEEYAKTCFRELFEQKTYYFTEERHRAIKRGGYFASRFLSVIVAYELKHDEKFLDRKKLFETARTDEKKLQEEYGDALRDVIEEKMRKIAELFAFELEDGDERSHVLLPSTLALTLLNERADDVEAVCIWAGDSRANCWDETNGLSVLTKDHDGAERNTSVGNLVTLSRPFYLETKYYKVKKPCVFLNYSDGCYDLATPFTVEYRLVSVFSDSRVNNYDQARAHFERMYEARENVDDSNTMALWSFGYNDFDTLKTAMENRLKYFEEKLDELHEENAEVNYSVKDRDYKVDRRQAVRVPMLNDWIKLPSVLDFLADLVQKDTTYKPYAVAVQKETNAFRAKSEYESLSEKEKAEKEKEIASDVARKQFAARYCRFKPDDCAEALAEAVWDKGQPILPAEARKAAEKALEGVEAKYAGVRETLKVWKGIEEEYSKKYFRFLQPKE